MNFLEANNHTVSRGAATRDAQMLSMLEESAKGMVRGAATWDAQTLSLLEESAMGMTPASAAAYRISVGRDHPINHGTGTSAPGCPAGGKNGNWLHRIIL